MTTAAAPDARPSTVRTWWLAIRPATLPAAVGPVLTGLGAAVGSGAALRPDTAVACLAVAILLQVAANLANDLSDFQRGADTPDRTGPLRVAAAGLVTPGRLRAAIAIVLGLAGVVGLFLVAVGGPVLLVLGALAMVAALAYTGGPLPYGYRGLGELFVFAFFGFVAVVGTAYLQTLTVEPLAWLAAVPVGALVTAILVVNNLRDIPTDRAADKRTLAVLLGATFAKAEYVALLGVGAVMPLVILSLGEAGPAVLLPIPALALAVGPARQVVGLGPDDDRRTLNPVLRATARLGLVYAVLFAIGLALGGTT
ncbi:MAG: 1,4-dihydroxy-2-naphthoate polyprenyltransferase [Candidatus Limnocylindria bacterium]